MNSHTKVQAPGLLSLLGRGWWVLLVYGVLAVLFGLFAVMRPLAAVAALAWMAGTLALAEGLISVFALFSRNLSISKGWLALYALASLAFGVLTLINPLVTAGVLLVLLAAWLVVGGIYRIVFAIRVRKVIQGEWLIILSGVLAIVLGVLFVLHPVSGLAVTALWIGVCALVYGTLQIVAAFKLRKFR